MNKELKQIMIGVILTITVITLIQAVLIIATDTEPELAKKIIKMGKCSEEKAETEYCKTELRKEQELGYSLWKDYQACFFETKECKQIENYKEYNYNYSNRKYFWVK